MTTAVVIKAHHGWPVKITKLDPKTGKELQHDPAVTVPLGEERTVYIHSGMDVLVHEVQPGETE